MKNKYRFVDWKVFGIHIVKNSLVMVFTFVNFTQIIA